MLGMFPLIYLVHPRRLMDLEEFLVALEAFLAAWASNSFEALVNPWNEEITRTVNVIIPE